MLTFLMILIAVMLAISVMFLSLAAGFVFAVNPKYKAKKEKPPETMSDFEKMRIKKYLKEQENMLNYTGDEQPEIVDT